jgi:hypothetical protein
MMVMGKRGPKTNVGKRVRGERNKGGDKKKPVERKGASCVLTKVICKQSIGEGGYENVMHSRKETLHVCHSLIML